MVVLGRVGGLQHGEEFLYRLLVAESFDHAGQVGDRERLAVTAVVITDSTVSAPDIAKAGRASSPSSLAATTPTAARLSNAARVW